MSSFLPFSEGRCQMSESSDIWHLISGCRLLAGGVDRDRTDDLKLAKLALSQLSYDPFQMSDSREQMSERALSSGI